MAVVGILLKLGSQLLNKRRLSLNDQLKLSIALLQLFETLFHRSSLLFFSSFGKSEAKRS